MKNDIPWQIIEKYLGNEAGEEEKKEIESWKNEAPENLFIFEQLSVFYKETGWLPLEYTPDVKTALNNVRKRAERKPNHIRLSPGWYRIAAALIAGILTFWLIQNISKNKNAQYTTLVTNDSTTTSVKLPDGSTAWLNASGTLEYNVNFVSNREIHLSGEAYFEVIKDTVHPFVVKTENTNIKVLGTKFNVRSFKYETKTNVSVFEGSVNFGNNTGKVILGKNETGTYDKLTDTLSVFSSNDPNTLAWKTHEMIFEDNTLDEVFLLLHRVYHFNYRFENSKLTQLKITTRFSKLTKEEIFEIITLATNISITEKDGEFIIQPVQ